MLDDGSFTYYPDVFFCWKEAAWLAKAAEYGYFARTESFEDEVAFEDAHYPNMVPVVGSSSIPFMDMPKDHPVSVMWTILQIHVATTMGSPAK